MKLNYLTFFAQKLEMGTVFIEDKATPVTFLYFEKPVILERKILPNYEIVLLSSFKEEIKKNINKAKKCFFQKKDKEVSKFVYEIKFENNSYFDVFSKLLSNLSLLKNLKVDISGKNKGKGFAGGMKRWNFSGLRASHGVSASHRSIGSIGQRSIPGRVHKGKKMPGRLGNENIYVKSLKVLDVDIDLGVLILKGSIPGNKKSFCKLHLNLKNFK